MQTRCKPTLTRYYPTQPCCSVISSFDVHSDVAAKLIKCERCRRVDIKLRVCPESRSTPTLGGSTTLCARGTYGAPFVLTFKACYPPSLISFQTEFRYPAKSVHNPAVFPRINQRDSAPSRHTSMSPTPQTLSNYPMHSVETGPDLGRTQPSGLAAAPKPGRPARHQLVLSLPARCTTFYPAAAAAVAVLPDLTGLTWPPCDLR
ncbi:hypothetical protein ElyMa_003029000 [Elysia marginata]|uniref:Uncharacterized protein n=1 Tax=Elysia marginata TaxID=1093978 RepID=A0AAV4IHH3_9GAST|nr:hypothetical protein ElyMa_003029000 [Elysia marginata]